MSDINKLVEDYFAPRSKTLTKQMLYEMFDEALEAEKAEDELQDIVQFLRNNGYENAQEKERNRNRIVITNMGGKDNRDAAIKKLQKEFKLTPTITYTRDKSKYIGGVLPEELGANTVLLRHGTAPLQQETMALTNLQTRLKELSAEFDKKDKLQIVFTGANFSKIYSVIPSALDVPKTPKADFTIGKGKNKIYISHKAGMTPKDFGQWSGISKKAGIIHQDSEVIEFGETLAKILNELKLSEYPSKIDIQKEIKSPKLMLQAVFGKDYGKKKSSADNVDFVVQGDITLQPALNLDTDELTGKFIIGGARVFSREHAPRNYPEIKSFFEGGYLPRITARRGDSGRRSFGIHSARGAIQSEGGRGVNFLLTENSTPKKIQFAPLCLDNGQFKQVKEFFADLEKEGITPENNTIYAKMRESITNFSNEDCGKK